MDILDKKLTSYLLINEHIIESAKIILEKLPAENCSYFYESIKVSMKDNYDGGKYFNAKV